MPIMGATKNFRKNPFAFMQANSVFPPHEREMKIISEDSDDGPGPKKTKYDPGFDVKGTDIPTDGMFSRYFDDDKIIDHGKMVTGSYKLSEVTTPIGHMKLVDSPVYNGAYTFSVKNEPAHDTLPIWFLPWKSDKIVRMRIPPRPARHTQAESPMIFFTAAINGCSVFATGGVASPLVAHAGTEDSTPYGGDAAGFWRALFEVSLDGDTANPIGEVNNTHYVNDTGVSKTLHTINADAYKRWLTQNLQPGRKVKQIKPQGCVFGYRDRGGLWNLYLQENATVTTVRCVSEKRDVTVRRELEKRTLFGVKKKLREVTEEMDVWLEVESTVTKPMRVSKFFPTGAGVATYPTTFQLV